MPEKHLQAFPEERIYFFDDKWTLKSERLLNATFNSYHFSHVYFQNWVTKNREPQSGQKRVHVGRYVCRFVCMDVPLVIYWKESNDSKIVAFQIFKLKLMGSQFYDIHVASK